MEDEDLESVITCPDCEGTGKEECYECEGEGFDDFEDQTCIVCNGEGAIECAECEGSGSLY